MTHCPACGEGGLREGGKYTNSFWPGLLLFFRDLEVVACPHCGFGFSWPEIPDADVNAFYDTEYRSSSSPFYVDFGGLEPALVPDYRSLAQILLAKQYVDFKADSWFVDVGPGAGHSFATAKRALPSARSAAVELNAGAAEAFVRLYGIETFRSLSELGAKGRKATICLLSHTLEHYKVSWLPAALSELAEAIAPGGVAVIEVPLVDMRLHAELRFDDAPHFLFFSPDSMRALLERNGWEVLFLASTSERYADWVASKASPSVREPASIGLNVRSGLRKLVSLMPAKAERAVRAALRDREIDFSNAQFAYGGDRTCLRVVARPRR